MKDTMWKVAHAALVLWAIVCTFLFFIGIPAYWYVVWKASKKAYPNGFFKTVVWARKNKDKFKVEFDRARNELVKHVEATVQDLVGKPDKEAVEEVEAKK
jgi:hypothetical protein